MEYIEFMRMCMQAHQEGASIDRADRAWSCFHCRGTGIKAVMCCGGYECACQGMPVDFTPCNCGVNAPDWFMENQA